MRRLLPSPRLLPRGLRVLYIGKDAPRKVQELPFRTDRLTHHRDERSRLNRWPNLCLTKSSEDPFVGLYT